jgi:hypothetical protein
MKIKMVGRWYLGLYLCKAGVSAPAAPCGERSEPYTDALIETIETKINLDLQNDILGRWLQSPDVCKKKSEIEIENGWSLVFSNIYCNPIMSLISRFIQDMCLHCRR